MPPVALDPGCLCLLVRQCGGRIVRVTSSGTGSGSWSPARFHLCVGSDRCRCLSSALSNSICCSASWVDVGVLESRPFFLCLSGLALGRTRPLLCCWTLGAQASAVTVKRWTRPCLRVTVGQGTGGLSSVPGDGPILLSLFLRRAASHPAAHLASCFPPLCRHL